MMLSQVWTLRKMTCHRKMCEIVVFSLVLESDSIKIYLCDCVLFYCLPQTHFSYIDNNPCLTIFEI